MNHSRRELLRRLLGLGAVAALAEDPESAIWIPGQRKIFIPPAPQADLGVLTLRNALESFDRFRIERGRAVLVQPRVIFVGNAGVWRVDRSGIHLISGD